ncbi:AMP-binding protein [Bacillus aquiflavi]|uniref:Phenylacetate-coenzyme A ligase n=1 Tax=Bacillus aquiflavi TaxID=2672567 RepID=A0A6B3VUU4_9BACI|nr:AMP-binding protein [Bacillus aquiflavi]MBA4537523.1 AMP-binding protein [Bacillus aquiflavi]NEY81779.1 AMP-binding protein [Bacillus aquiflavi]UAC47483.1 AMP-binding protein [Bacillus aquiflavi]
MILHEIETESRENIERLQLERLIKTVERAYNSVPFYQKKLMERNVIPERIKGLEDIRNLPFTKKQDLRDNYPFGLFAVDLKDLVRIHGSSGTSGKPTVVGYTKNDINNWSEIVARAIVIAGGKPGEILHNTYGYGLFTGGLGLHFGSEHLGMVTIPISGGNTDRQISLIEDFGPKVICGTPSYVLTIAEHMEEMGIDPRKTSLKHGIFGAEPWSEEMRKMLEEKFEITACDIYGLSEVIGPGVSMECYQAQDGLHVAEDHFLVEVIDSKTLEPVPDGQDGELVFTSLTKEAFPVLRYRTGDIGSINREKCKCGRTTIRMSRIKGRIDDMIIVRGVNVFPSEIEHYLLKVNEIAPHFQVHLLKRGYLDCMELNVEVTETFYKEIKGDMGNEKIFQLEKFISNLMKSSCLISMDVKIHPPKSIQRSEGKAVRVVNKRSMPINI